MPGSFQAVYNASKSFALALREELRDTGVTVTSLMPGPTDTEFFERADMLDTKVGSGDKDDPADVARDGFEALMAGDERAVSASLSTKLQGHGSRLMPDSVKARLHRGMPSRARATPRRTDHAGSIWSRPIRRLAASYPARRGGWRAVPCPARRPCGSHPVRA